MEKLRNLCTEQKDFIKRETAIVTDEGYCFSYYIELAEKIGYPSAACLNESADVRTGLEQGDKVIILAECEHPKNGTIESGSTINYGKLFVVERDNCQYIISEKGLDFTS